VSKKFKKAVMKMRVNGRVFQTVMAGCVLLLCSVYVAAQDVRYNYLQGTDFSKYRTYKWVRVPNAQYPNQILDDQIKQSLDAQMSMRGLAKTESDSPDLYVMYQLAIDKEKQWNAYNTGGDSWGWGGWRGWGGSYGGGMSTTTVTSSTINVGTLNVDFYDVATKKQVWRGEATKTVKAQKDPRKLQKNLDKAMAKLMKNYPPPVK
jgi:hypothetical protein